MMLLEAIRNIHAQKAGRVVPGYAIDHELRQLAGLSQADLDGQAAELVEAGFINIGRYINGQWYQLVEE